ncbi:hypothetical protein MY3296_005203 [Beauveria thailandica]
MQVHAWLSRSIVNCVESRPLQIIPAGCRDGRLKGRTGDPLKRPGITTRENAEVARSLNRRPPLPDWSVPDKY